MRQQVGAGAKGKGSVLPEHRPGFFGLLQSLEDRLTVVQRQQRCGQSPTVGRLGPADDQIDDLGEFKLHQAVRR